jgi:hypothetical protein
VWLDTVDDLKYSVEGFEQRIMQHHGLEVFNVPGADEQRNATHVKPVICFLAMRPHESWFQ